MSVPMTNQFPKFCGKTNEMLTVKEGGIYIVYISYRVSISS